MIGHLEDSKRGAPVRVLLLIFGCWVVGRLVWGGFSIEPAAIAISAVTAANPVTSFTDPPKSIPRKTAGNPSVSRAFKSAASLNYISDPAARGSILLKGIDWPRPTSIVMKNQRPSVAKRAPLEPDTNIAATDQSREAAVRFELEDPSNINGETKTASRLSGYFWLFARKEDGALNSGRVSPGNVGPNYGGSQIGAILAYRLFGTTERNVSLFGRLSAAKTQGRLATQQEEIAFGVRAKPFSNLPVSVHAEQRFDLRNGENRGTAIYVSGGTGPTEVIRGIEAETYGQAGFVFDRQNNYFLDGSALLRKNLFAKDRKKLNLGAGVWAGGQRNVRRLDVGPRVDFRLPLGKSSARLSVDWRHRVAGNAAPDSGVAVTLSTGF